MTRRPCAAVLCLLATAALARAEDDCLARPEVQAHVSALRDHVYEAWTPAPSDPPAEVKLRLVLRADGSLETSEIVTASHSSAAVSALAAIQKVKLPPLPEAARCLAGRKLVATFRTPEAEPAPPAPLDTRVRWIVYGVLAVMFVLLLAVVWRATRVHPAAEAPYDGPLPSEGELRRSGTAQWVHLAGIGHLPLLALRDPLWLAAAALVDLVLVAEFFRSRRRPLVRFSNAEVVVYGDFAREKRIRAGELSSWAATANVLGLRSVGGPLLLVPLAYLSPGDARLLLAVVRRMPRVSSSQPPLTVEELQRTQRRRMVWIVTAAFAASVLLLELLPSAFSG